MDINLRIFLIILVILSNILVLMTIKTKKLSMKFGLYWNVILCLMLLLIIFPNLIEMLAKFLGFKEAPNMLFILAIFILFYKIFSIYGNLSKLNDSNKDVIQELAILEYELEKKRKR